MSEEKKSETASANPPEPNVTQSAQSVVTNLSDYRVGNRRPPVHSRFKPGQSGNPKGRPRGSRNWENELVAELSERIPIREGNRRRTLSKQRALTKALVNRALGGDVKATFAIFAVLSRLGAESPAPTVEQALEPSDARIIEDFLERKLKAKVDFRNGE
jgi:Family of unknown function (DUF5681)